MRELILGLPRPVKSSIAFSSDLIGFAFCVVAALWLTHLDPYVSSHIPVVVATALLSLFLAWSQGMYRSVVRYMGLDLFVAGGQTALVSAGVGALLMQLFAFGATPYRWAIAYAAFSFIYICGSRYLARVVLVKRRASEHRERVIIYGAGIAGVQLAASLQDGDDYLPVAMLDDNPKLHGNKVRGLEVYSPTEVKELCDEMNVSRLLLAIPSAKMRRRREILESLSEFPVHVQTVPEFNDIVSGKASVDEIADVSIEELLGRDPVPPNPELLVATISGKSVLVTGAGGSIGSELCRQILALDPRRLILQEISESALYNINNELESIRKETGSGCEIVPLMGSVHHERKLRKVMEVFKVQTLYHAAAYKHVPLVEYNLFEGIHNNVLGTVHTACAAIEAGVETFVLVSTDKAVNPTSVMGATKRLAELVLQAYASQESSTRFCMVRFGNVLGSSGSVVPLFREQIRKGGPVTVTHREIIRYFMTIPEAAELVIQAGSMAQGGDVFVLDMGEPVRIEDLAHRMINLMGLTVQTEGNPDGDIAIEYVGLRPAEKLYEELLIGSNVTGTNHPRIWRADEGLLPFDVVAGVVVELKNASTAMDFERARSLLKDAVLEYDPDNAIDDLIWLGAKASQTAEEVAAKIVDFPSKKA